jgi:hypothetical protein
MQLLATGGRTAWVDPSRLLTDTGQLWYELHEKEREEPQLATATAEFLKQLFLQRSYDEIGDLHDRLSEEAERTRLARRQAKMQKPFPDFDLPAQMEIPGKLEIIRLINGLELHHEGEAMHHCVGSYLHNCQLDTAVYSIRDADHQRVATLELRKDGDTWSRGQLCGPCNQAVDQDISNAVNLLIEEINESKKVS